MNSCGVFVGSCSCAGSDARAIKSRLPGVQISNNISRLVVHMNDCAYEIYDPIHKGIIKSAPQKHVLIMSMIFVSGVM